MFTSFKNIFLFEKFHLSPDHIWKLLFDCVLLVFYISLLLVVEASSVICHHRLGCSLHHEPILYYLLIFNIYIYIYTHTHISQQSGCQGSFFCAYGTDENEAEFCSLFADGCQEFVVSGS